MNRKISLVMLLVVGQCVSAQVVREERCVDTTHYLRGVTGTKGNNSLLYTAGEGGVHKYERDNSRLRMKTNIFDSQTVSRIAVTKKRKYVAFITTNKEGYVYGIGDDEEKYFYMSPENLRAVHINKKYVYFGEEGTGYIVRVKLKDFSDDVISEERLRVSNVSDADLINDLNRDIREIDSHSGDVIVATNDGHVYLFNENNWKRLKKFKSDKSHAEVAQIDKQYIWYASDSKDIWVRENDGASHKKLSMFGGPPQPTNDITAVRRHKTKWMFTSTDAGMIHVYEDFTENPMEVQTFLPQRGSGRAEYLWLDNKQKLFYVVFGRSDEEGFDGDRLICVYNYG